MSLVESFVVTALVCCVLATITLVAHVLWVFASWRVIFGVVGFVVLWAVVHAVREY